MLVVAASVLGLLGGVAGSSWVASGRWRHADEAGAVQVPVWVGAVVCGAAAGAAAWATRETATWPVIVATAVWCVGAWVAALVDAAVMRVPEPLVLAMYAVLLVVLGGGAAVTGDWRSLGRAAAAAVALWVGFFLYSLVAQLGFADVQLMGVSGLVLGWLGWDLVVRAVVFVFIVGGVWAAALLARGHRGRMAYAPPLLLGVWLAIASSPW